MRRLLIPFTLVFIACRAISAGPARLHTQQVTPQTSAQTEVPTSLPTLETTLEALLTYPTPQAPSPPEEDFSIRIHPDGPLFVGDAVSFEVIAPENYDLSSFNIRLEAPGVHEIQSSAAGFSRYGIAGRNQATLLWVWDTSGLGVGVHQVKLTILPDGPTWTEWVMLHPNENLPKLEKQADWQTVERDCCRVHYISGTSAARDITRLLSMVDRQVESATQKLALQPEEPLDITFIPRVIGHGGFARNELSVSYLDRNYAASDITTVLHHEIIHALDSELGGELRPLLFVEGLAVYLSGGHFKPEPLMPRAAALLPPASGCADGTKQACGLNLYIPLEALVDDFYHQQHEIGYLQAGALVEFMVDTWGWERFSDFYRQIRPVAGPDGSNHSQYQAINRATKTHFNLSFKQLEDRFLEALSQELLKPGDVQDVHYSVAFYDTVRRYQLSLDPSAFFMTAWLPDGAQMRERSIEADYLRHPERLENLAIETMLVSAEAYLRDGDYGNANKTLEAINTVLDIYPREGSSAFSASTLAADYLALIETVIAAGYQPQRINIKGQTALIFAYHRLHIGGSRLSELAAIKRGDNWEMVLMGN